MLSKGQIVGAWVQPCSQGSTVTGWGLQVEPSMLPSFRVVAFYYLASGEIVADAMWLGIKDSCMGTVSTVGEALGGHQGARFHPALPPAPRGPHRPDGYAALIPPGW